MQSNKTAAEQTVSVRLPVDLVEAARALSEESAGHPLGKRTAAELLAAGVRAGWPTVQGAVKAGKAKK